METPQTLPGTVEELKERYIRACGLKQMVDWERIVECFQQWAAAIKIEVSAVVRLEEAEQIKTALKPMLSVNIGRFASVVSHQRGAYFGTKTAQAAQAAHRVQITFPAWTGRARWARRLGGDTNVWRQARAGHSGIPLWADVGKRLGWAGDTLSNGKVVWDATRISIYAIGAFESAFGSKFSNWYPIFEAFEAGAYCFFITDQSIEVCTLPSAVSVDENNRLHSASGPAFAWLKDVRDYYWHGVHVEPYVVENPERITVADIEAEPNAEVRRAKIERFGHARYLVASGAREIHRDDFGALYRKDIPGNEPLVMVKVVNATPEPDGSFKDYFLRVPPGMQTAREAVAWTFGKTPDDYGPEKES